MSGFLRRSYLQGQKISGLTTDEAFLGAGRQSYTGRYVSPETAMTIATVFACVRVIANNIAQLPLKIYRRDSAGRKEEAANHPLWPLVQGRPNPLMGPFIWKQTVFASALMRGNAYVEIEFAGSGWPAALWPLQASGMSARLEKRQAVYEYSPSPSDVGTFGRIPDYRVHHMRSLANDGFEGRSVVREAMHTLELALAAEEFGARFFGNGAVPGTALLHPGELSPQAKENIRESFDAKHMGMDKSHKTAVLEEGMTIEKIGIPPEDAQFLGTRQFQTIEICRWFGVPPHMVYDLERATFSNIEHQSIAFVQDSLMPWIVNHEEQMGIDLLQREGWESNLFMDYDVDQRLRGDTPSRYRTYQSGIMYGQLSPNEARAKENQPPYAGGDQYFRPGNLTPVDGSGADAPAMAGERDVRQAERELRQAADDQALRDLWAAAQSGLQARLENVVALETAAIREALEDTELTIFVSWLQRFYDDEAPEAYREAIGSLLQTLAARTGRIVVLSLEESWTEELQAELEAYADEVLTQSADGHAASHRRQIEALIRDEGAEAGEAAARAAVEERLIGWSETEAERQARKVAFSAGNAFALAGMGAVGIAAVAWAARGDSCKFCRALDGKVVAIGEAFVGGDDSVTADDGEALTVSNPRRHGPLHEGCDCTVRAVRES
ncbi:MAG: phage portal protein [Chloroflexota bacterium]|nr:phage portal protein [Chloroflexota bacterium]